MRAVNFNQSGILTNSHLCYRFLQNSCIKHIYPLTSRIIMYIIMWAIIVFTVLGNMFVIIAISHFRQLHTPTNYLILSLAITDLLIGGILMPPTVIRTVETCWYLGDIYCKFHSSADTMLCMTSLLHIFIISVDRYFAICHPLRYKSKFTVVLITKLVFFCWSVSAIYGFGMIFVGLSINFYDESSYCIGSCVLIQNKVSNLVSALFTTYIPGLIMVGIYIKIYIVASKQSKSIREMNKEYGDVGLRKRERKAAKTLAIVLGVFLSCWSPVFFWYTLNPFITFSAPILVIEFLLIFAYMNSTFNPLIYAFFYSWFRKALKIIIHGKIFDGNSSSVKLYNE
ncbi:trace amine-associated receptor 1-like [Erpetoichthys calabaricus]|uniref:trace amine-associated receptor 1-like n=1 Tax=Erpetoichthys calabaricus TaxID=27687 RepID=UPI0022341B72|nr:trace amine-associated receptor 1-like [Erpetoichthys calabaricus]